jgi:thioredoxin 1
MKQLKTLDDYEVEKQQHEYLLLKISASWCGPCQSFAPVVESVSKARNDVSVAEIDVDTLPNVREIFKVSSVPTLIMLKNGSQIDSLVGSAPHDKVNAWIDQAIKA